MAARLVHNCMHRDSEDELLIRHNYGAIECYVRVRGRLARARTPGPLFALGDGGAECR